MSVFSLAWCILVYGKFAFDEKFDKLWKSTWKLRRAVRVTETEDILDGFSSEIGCTYLMIWLHRVQRRKSSSLVHTSILNPIYIEICLAKCLVHAVVSVGGVCCILFSLYCSKSWQYSGLIYLLRRVPIFGEHHLWNDEGGFVSALCRSNTLEYL